MANLHPFANLNQKNTDSGIPYMSLNPRDLVLDKKIESGGTQSPIVQVYNRYSYFDEMKAAVTTWEACLAALVENR